MAITNYAELKTAVLDFAHRSELSTTVADLIMLGEKRIYREVRAVSMEHAFSGAISGGVLTAVDAGLLDEFLEFKLVYINSNGANVLQPKTLEWIYKNYPTRSASGMPKFITATANDAGLAGVSIRHFEFGPYPDSNYTVAGVYYIRPPSVTSENGWTAVGGGPAAHVLASDNPDLYLFAALAELAAYSADDPRIPAWENRYARIRDALNREQEVAALSGAPLRVTPR